LIDEVSQQVFRGSQVGQFSQLSKRVGDGSSQLVIAQIPADINDGTLATLRLPSGTEKELLEKHKSRLHGMGR
jgi:hypothetical protein